MAETQRPGAAGHRVLTNQGSVAKVALQFGGDDGPRTIFDVLSDILVNGPSDAVKYQFNFRRLNKVYRVTGLYEHVEPESLKKSRFRRGMIGCNGLAQSPRLKMPSSATTLIGRMY